MRDKHGISRVDLLWEKERILAAFERSEYPYDFRILGQ